MTVSTHKITPVLVAKFAAAAAISWGAEAAGVLAGVRTRATVRARWCVWYELHRRGWSYAEIGRQFNTDHSTILNGAESVDDLLRAGDVCAISCVEDLAGIGRRARGRRDWVELPSGERLEIETFDRGISKTWRPVHPEAARRLFGASRSLAGEAP